VHFLQSITKERLATFFEVGEDHGVVHVHPGIEVHETDADSVLEWMIAVHWQVACGMVVPA
jgi:hypothetical protein